MGKDQWAVLALISTLTVLRFVSAAMVGLGDVEAYYWTWSEELGLSYHDHGPVVALLIRFGTSVLGQTSLGVRAPFILISALTLILAGRLGGIWSVVGLCCMPVFLVAGGAANPDVPFLFLVLCFVAVLLRIRASTRHSLKLLALAGLIWGIAFASKYMGLLLGIPLLFIAWSHRRRVAAVTLPCLMALPGALPVLIWNAGRDWPTLSYHLMSRHTRPVGLSLANLGKLFGGQLAYLSPLVLVALGAVAATLWRRRSQDAEARLLLACAAPLLLSGYLLILLVPGAEPHWPAAGYLPLLVALGPLLPIWLKERRRARVLTTIGVVFSLLVALGFHVHILTDLGVRIMPASYVPRYDLSNELRGWPSVADAAADWLGSLPREQRTRVVVGGCHYTSCSQLAFAARGRFRVVCPSVRADQYDQSAGGDGADLRGVDLLYLYDERFPFSTERLYRCRGAPEKVREVEIVRASRVVRRFSLHLCRGFSGLAADRWPPP